jgi:ketosteroid isomerase-like protein
VTYYLAENAWPLVAVFGLIGVGFLVALRVTQNGRYLVRALIALGLAAVALIVEQVWVTDAERIEAVVRELADAVRRSDADAALALMGDHVAFGIRNQSISDDLDLNLIRGVLRDVKFDWLYLSRLSASAGKQTHMGQAEFKVNAGGTYQGSNNFVGLSEWSLGFHRTPDGAWKITRITATKLPLYAMLPPQFRQSRQPDGSPSPSTSPTIPREPASPFVRGFGPPPRGPR